MVSALPNSTYLAPPPDKYHSQNLKVVAVAKSDTENDNLRHSRLSLPKGNKRIPSSLHIPKKIEMKSGTLDPGATPNIGDQAAISAKRRFRQQHHQTKAQKPSISRDESLFSKENTRDTVIPLQGCPKCSMPLLYQDLSTSNDGGKPVVLSHSVSSHTTRSLDHNRSGPIISCQDDYPIQDYDPQSFISHIEVASTAATTYPSCGFAVPLVSILESFVGKYCDSMCIDQMASRKHNTHERTVSSEAIRPIPPYCPNCKVYVIQEKGDEERQDQMLSNLASWLASTSSSSSSDAGTSEDGSKLSKVAFRPSHGSITIMSSKGDSLSSFPATNSRIFENPELSLMVEESSPKSSVPSSHFEICPNDGEPIEWDTLMQGRTPRMGIIPRTSFPSSPGLPDRYSIEDDEPFEKKKNHGFFNSHRIPRSPLRRRAYMDLLEDTEKETVFDLPSVMNKRFSFDPRSRAPLSQHPERIQRKGEELTLTSQALQADVMKMKVFDDPTSLMRIPEPLKVITSPTPKFPEVTSDVSRNPEIVIQIQGTETREVNKGLAENNISVECQMLQSDMETDDKSLGSCYTLKEEASIIKDYEKKRDIATKAIGRKLMEGFILTQTQCNHCQMPVMENKGISECVVCPLVFKKAKKRADLRRKGQAILDTFDSDSSPKRIVNKTSNTFSNGLDSPNMLHNSNMQQSPSPRAEQRDNTDDYIFASTSNVNNLMRKDESHILIDDAREATYHEDENCRLSQLDKGDDSEGPFESLKQIAVAEDQQDISGLLINWDHDETREDVNDSLHRNFLVDGEGVYDIIEQDSEEEIGQNDENSDFSGSEGYEVEIGSQEVYRRLLSGWLLTNSKCTQCLTPLMQSPLGEVECAVCISSERILEANRSESSLPYNFNTHLSVSEAKTKGEKNETDHTEYHREKSKDLEGDRRLSTFQESVPTNSGLRYFAIPENLDIHDHEALLSFITNKSVQEQVFLSEASQNNFDQTLLPQSVGKTNQQQHGIITREQSDPSNRNLDLKPSPSNAGDEMEVSKSFSQNLDTKSFSSPSFTLLTNMHDVRLGPQNETEYYWDETNLPKNGKYSITSDFKSKDTWQTNEKSGFQGKIFGESLSVATLSTRDSRSSGQRQYNDETMCFPLSRNNGCKVNCNEVLPKNDLQPESGFETESFAKWNQGHSYVSNKWKGHDFLPQDKRLQTYNLHDDLTLISDIVFKEDQESPAVNELPIKFKEYSSHERNSYTESSSRSDTGAVVYLKDDKELILKFDSFTSYSSANDVSSKPSSASRAQPAMESKAQNMQVESVAQTDLVLHHVIRTSKQNDSICRSCKGDLKFEKRSSPGLICRNPRCVLYLIPGESVDAFTAAMYDTDDMVEFSGPKTKELALKHLVWSPEPRISSQERHESGIDTHDDYNSPRMFNIDHQLDSKYQTKKHNVRDESEVSMTGNSSFIMKGKSDASRSVKFNESPENSFSTTKSSSKLYRDQRSQLLYVESPDSEQDFFKSSTMLDDDDVVQSECLDALVWNEKVLLRPRIASEHKQESRENRNEVEMLIDRLASAALAIEELEKSVVEAEDSSPRHSNVGRPPTSSQSRAPARLSEKEIRWF